MKTHSTNYYDTFIEVSEDCPSRQGVPPQHPVNKETIAAMQFARIRDNPYRYSSDDLLFEIHAIRKGIPAEEREKARATFFSKGQACLRSSPLVKRYGWGIHHNAEGKVALYGAETPEYGAFLDREDVKKVKGMRSKRKKGPA